MEPCPNCASRLTEALQSSGSGKVRLRCPECESCFAGSVGAQELESGRLEARASLLAAYEASVTEQMTALADRMSEALARDLIGADDFRPSPRRAA